MSERLGSPYRSGRVAHWLKIKNPAAPALTREAEEDPLSNDFIDLRVIEEANDLTAGKAGACGSYRVPDGKSIDFP